MNYAVQKPIIPTPDLASWQRVCFQYLLDSRLDRLDRLVQHWQLARCCCILKHSIFDQLVAFRVSRVLILEEEIARCHSQSVAATLQPCVVLAEC